MSFAIAFFPLIVLADGDISTASALHIPYTMYLDRVSIERKICFLGFADYMRLDAWITQRFAAWSICADSAHPFLKPHINSFCRKGGCLDNIWLTLYRASLLLNPRNCSCCFQPSLAWLGVALAMTVCKPNQDGLAYHIALVELNLQVDKTGYHHGIIAGDTWHHQQSPTQPSNASTCFQYRFSTISS